MDKDKSGYLRRLREDIIEFEKTGVKSALLEEEEEWRQEFSKEMSPLIVPIRTRVQAEFLQGGEYGPQLKRIIELLEQILGTHPIGG